MSCCYPSAWLVCTPRFLPIAWCRTQSRRPCISSQSLASLLRRLGCSKRRQPSRIVSTLLAIHHRNLSPPLRYRKVMRKSLSSSRRHGNMPRQPCPPPPQQQTPHFLLQTPPPPSSYHVTQPTTEANVAPPPFLISGNATNPSAMAKEARKEALFPTPGPTSLPSTPGRVRACCRRTLTGRTRIVGRGSILRGRVWMGVMFREGLGLPLSGCDGWRCVESSSVLELVFSKARTRVCVVCRVGLLLVV